MADRQTCFVIQGFGEKTDYYTGRQLNLDASYAVIKEAVEEAGLSCVRLDEVAVAGAVDDELFKLLYEADIVIADLSAYTLTAAYELGIRLAWRRRGTIVVAEKGFRNPFDMPMPVRLYEHRGKVVGSRHAAAFKHELQSAIKEALAGSGEDSPVYQCLQLEPPKLTAAPVAAAPAAAAPQPPLTSVEDRVAKIIEKAREATRRNDHAEAAVCYERARRHRHDDPWIVQQLAQATSRSQVPDPQTALLKAREILRELNPETSNDPETLGLWGSVHKRLWEQTSGVDSLDVAIDAYERGFRLRDDAYNGINLAFLLDARAMAAAAGARDEALTDAVLARRVRQKVLHLCARALESEAEPEPGGSPAQYDRYWVRATMVEAYVGLGDEAAAANHLAMLEEEAALPWMLETTRAQIAKLRALLASSPLRSAAAL